MHIRIHTAVYLWRVELTAIVWLNWLFPAAKKDESERIKMGKRSFTHDEIRAMSTGDHPLMEGLPDIDLDVDPFDVEALKAMHPWLKVHCTIICTWILTKSTRILTKTSVIFLSSTCIVFLQLNAGRNKRLISIVIGNTVHHTVWIFTCKIPTSTRVARGMFGFSQGCYGGTYNWNRSLMARDHWSLTWGT